MGTERLLRLARRLSLVGAGFAALVVLAGAWTRLVDAGLGCPDWPGCYGELVVPDAARALVHSPEAPLEAAKAWMEMLHRYLAAALGLMVLVLVALGTALRRRLSGYPWALTLALLALILLQGAFGALTVTLKLWPQVVTLHLLGGLSVMTLFLWLSLRLGRLAGGEPAQVRPRRFSPLWGAAMLLLVLQLALGGWTSSNYAGIACQGFPTCNGEWWPSLDWGEGFHLTQTVGPNYLHGQLHAEARSAIQVGHRLGALALLACLAGLAWRYGRDAARRPWLVLAAGLAQAAIGVANVVFWLPLWLALLHTAGAVALVVALTLAAWQWRWPSAVVVSNPDERKEWAHV
ncbi:heme A synthase [Halomonas beimenensis]|uniref:Heme A synthase, cytochrome oxidase biogenesis protein Cox15-CtaA n=1 Tax=Halomonas beimenensis TaxID=475662 RepID=A0A291P7N9_9GAMM|nr:COX15/CtaA family protein [Halomonas beimenensis]ATJ82916.1 heme A synthase, cytochrome oxidase biogenesis protein Cox15-CtaA [Halomonas beimenensis]